MALPTIFIGAYFIGLFGLILASQIKELENFAGVMNFVIFPAFFLSSALYPLWQIEETSEIVHPSLNQSIHLRSRSGTLWYSSNGNHGTRRASRWQHPFFNRSSPYVTFGQTR